MKTLSVVLMLLALSIILLFRYTSTQAVSEMSIATGQPGGLYHRFGVLLKAQLEARGVKVRLINTHGSNENARLIQQGKADFSIIQTGIGLMDKLEVVTPLFVEPIMILSAQDSKIERIADLKGKRIHLGAEGSGSRVSGQRILEHYEITSYQVFSMDKPAKGESPEAIITVGGLLNQNIKTQVREHQLNLIEIDDAQAVSLKYPHLHPFIIPKGIFSETPSIPAVDVQSLASTAILIGANEVSESQVALVLQSIYETNLRIHFPLMMTPDQVKQWSLFPLKPASLKFLDPYSGIGVFANFAESLAAIKELIFALFAMMYFLWLGYQRVKEKRALVEYSVYKEKLDVFLDETITIERLSLGENDIDVLSVLLRNATNLKLRALGELTHEKLRGDAMFTIFLTQCSHLMMQIESKIHRQ